MGAELNSIVTKALEKKNGKLGGLAALMKNTIDEKAFEESLKKAIDKNLKDNTTKPMILSLKQEPKTGQAQTKQDQKQQNQKTTSHSDEQKELLYRQVLSQIKATSEVSTEKSIKELKDLAKDDKKLSKLLEKVEQIGIKAEIKIEQISEKELEAKKIKKASDKKDDTKSTQESQNLKNTKEQSVKTHTTEDAKVKVEPKDIEPKDPKSKPQIDTKQPENIDKKELKKEMIKEAVEVKKEAETKDTKNLKLSETEEAQKSLSKKDTKETAETVQKEIVNTKKEAIKEAVEVKKEAIKEAVEVKKEAEPKTTKQEEKKAIIEDKKELQDLQAQKIATKDITIPGMKTDEKIVQVKKQDDKATNLSELLTNLSESKPKVDESLEKRKDGDAKKESHGDEKANVQLASSTLVSDTKSVEDSIAQKIKDAPLTLKNFTDDLKDKIDEYKPPIMKVSMELRPENMAPVDVTMITRGQNLIININSSDEALKMFMSNANDFRQNLMNIGFTEMTMNFSFKDQNGEKRQYQYQEQGSKKYKEIADSSVNTVTDIEVIVPRYA